MSKVFRVCTEDVGMMHWGQLFSLFMNGATAMRVALASALLSLLMFGDVGMSGLAYGAKPLPDYVISASVNNPPVTDSLSITYTVTNQSDVAALLTSVRFVLASTTGPSRRKVLGEVSSPALEPWRQVVQTVSFPLPSLASFKSSHLRLLVQVNRKRKPRELQWTNNTVEVEFDVQKDPPVPAPADLKVSILNAPDSVRIDSILAIEEMVRNLGAGAAGSFTISYQLRNQAQLIALGSRSVSGLPSGASTTGALNVSLPTTVAPGSYILGIQASNSEGASDANPADNVAEKEILLVAPDSTPPDGTFLQDANVHVVPTLPRPELHVPFVDPTFGTTIVRLTDPSMSASDSEHVTLGLRHQYSRQPALNADHTKMVVRVLGGVYRGFFEVREVATGALLRRLAPDGDPEVSWHPTDSNRFFYRAGNEVRSFAVDSGLSETMMRFPQYVYISTREEGRPSDDWRYYAFLGYRDNSFASADIVVADLVEKRIVATWPNSGIPDWVSMSPSGEYVVAMWVSGEGTRVYSRTTLELLNLAFSDFGHADFAFDGEGQEVLVYHATSGKQLLELGNPAGAPFAMARLADGKKTVLQSVSWDMTPHFCGLASREHPGWVLVSTYADATAPQRPFSREIYWLKLDGSSEVRRIAHHHSDQAFRSGPWGVEKDYFAEPQATSSWDGNLVVFASVWNEPFNHYDSYLLSGSWW